MRNSISREEPLPDLAGDLARFGEEVAAEPEKLEGALLGMISGVRARCGLVGVGLSATVGESRHVSVSDGDTYRGSGGAAEEFPMRRGKILVGTLTAYPPEWEECGAAGSGALGPGWREELRTVAAIAALALDAAHARELSARRAAHGSVVQIASEALGAILDERKLYETVLVLTLELLDASGGAVLLEDGDVVSLGLDDAGETLRALEGVRPRGRTPWVGRLGRHHAVGVRLGRDNGAVFLLREERPYTEAEGVSLKLVARQLAHARERSRLYASLEETTLEAISALAAALESRDNTTGDHIKRTQVLAGEVARRLGLSAEEVRTAEYAAVLHDVGKIGTPDAILNKPGKLTQGEWEIMRRHPRIGAEIVGRISGFGDVTRAVLYHHERHDGRGYPEGIAGSGIPYGARLISVVDAYDAMTNDRPYRAALTHEQAIAELDANSGSQFDPRVVEALKAVMLEREAESEPDREEEPRP